MTEYEERKQKILELVEDSHYKPMKQKEIAYLLQISSGDREQLSQILAELVSEGKVMLTKRGKYQSMREAFRVGSFTGHRKGFGFVTVEGEPEDYFIPADATAGAMHGDKVMIRLMKAPQGRRKEAQVVRIMEHALDEIVGYYQQNRNYGFVTPDNRRLSEDVYVSKVNSMGAVTGHKVVVKLTDYGGDGRQPEGIVTEILGHVNDPGTDILSVVRAYELPMDFPDAVMEEITSLPDRVSEAECGDRLDMRMVQTVTIDGEDAKDLDDAVTLEKMGDGYLLGVHIADVSHYVREGSPLDAEARRRGTSVYLVDRVIPMLPHRLSNGICSLNAGEDRLALSCIMELDAEGRLTGHRIVRTVIRVDRRMSYTQVDTILRADSIDQHTEYDDVDWESNLSLEDVKLILQGRELRGQEILSEYENELELFRNMKELSDKIRDRRKKRGSIDFDFPETMIRLSPEGEPIWIGPYDRNPAHKIIEDFMLTANETVAEDYYWQELPFEYRTHGAPDPEKVERLQKLMAGFGYYFKASGEKLHPKEIQKLLERIQGTPEENFLSRMTLRSMQQARYTTECSGHFGLAAKYYCHFTSPIRRYPDLQIHRIIKENLKGRLNEERILHYDRILPGVAESNSSMERRAQEVEREVEKLKKVQYMSSRIGKSYDGIISGVTAYGLYVELPNTVEGMVRISDIPDDFYLFHEQDMSISGMELGKTYRMGQKVRVCVARVDKVMRTIDFMLEE